jgi:hypothetical protein
MLTNIILLNMIGMNIPHLPYNLILLEDIKPGDHIFRYGALFKQSLLTHHGIYIGNNNVIHFSGGSDDSKNLNDYENDMKTAKIVIATFDEFMNTKQHCFKVNGYITKYARKKILNRAFSKLDTNFDDYCPVTNNCEHFVNWCYTGEKTSTQSDFVISSLKKIIHMSDENKNKLNEIIPHVKKITNAFEYLPKIKLTSVIVNSLEKITN